MSTTATHAHDLTMGDGHRCSLRVEGPFPRATRYDFNGAVMAKVNCERMASTPVHFVFNSPSKSRSAPTKALFIARMLWCLALTAHFAFWHSALSLHFFLHSTRLSSLARDSYLQLLFCLHRQFLCAFSMARKRGKPRRGST